MNERRPSANATHEHTPTIALLFNRVQSMRAIVLSVLLLVLLPCTGASPLQWRDVTAQHPPSRRLHGLVHRSANLPAHANVRRAPSPTVFIYSVNTDVGAAAAADTMDLPLCHGGGVKTFRVSDSGMMPPELQAEFPDVRSLLGRADDGTTAEIVTSTAGIRAQIWTSGKPRW